ncbi:MAG: sugar ABC transporter substrate-binding protein [Solirubrobacterales bacterium]
MQNQFNKPGLRGRGAIAVLSMLAIGAALLSGCGSSGGSSSSSGGSATTDGSTSTSGLAPFEKKVAAYFKGTSTAPVGGPVKTEPGKTVWAISVGQSVEAAQLTSKAVQELGKKLGWNVSIYDGKFESSRELTGIQQAIAAGADGIILEYIDCDPVKAGLEEAAEAGIPIVGIESKDCAPSLEKNILFAEGATFEEWIKEIGESAGAWLVTETEGDAKAIITEETDATVTSLEAKGAQEEIENCESCEVLETIQFTGTSFNTLQQKIEQALNQNPEANAFFGNYGAVMTVGGGAAALRASGRLGDIKSAVGEGSASVIELLRGEEGVDACTGSSVEWEGYESVTLMARLFAGQDPSKSNSGIGVQLCDREHNLPPEGKGFEFPIDYVSAYEKILGLK